MHNKSCMYSKGKYLTLLYHNFSCLLVTTTAYCNYFYWTCEHATLRGLNFADSTDLGKIAKLSPGEKFSMGHP